MNDASPKPITGRKVFIWLAGFFLLVIIMNIIMVYLGNQSWTGLTTEKAYDKGIKYNDVIEEAAKQTALGWSVTIGPVVETRQQEGTANIQLAAEVVGKGGETLPGLEVSARLTRPTSEGSDQSVDFSSENGRRYSAQVALPLRGQWDVHLTARNSQGTYRVRHRIHIP